MSYQIKRTPYYRRIFNNSRRNGQLQRLREEYERIQEFNDRTIELKMREVRLQRLFRQIEDINELPNASATYRRGHLVPPSPEELYAQQRRQRLEALERARELGLEISRRNAQLADNGAGFYLRSELHLTAKMHAADEARRDAQERRQRAARRISYGNAQSRFNIERLVQQRQRRLVAGDSPATVMQLTPSSSSQAPLQQQQQQQLHPDIAKRAMLQQRLEYGNSRSSSNMLRRQLLETQRAMNCIAAEVGDDPDTEELRQQQLLSVAHFLPTTSICKYNNNTNNSIIININNSQNNANPIDSETEMQTALLPPTDTDMMLPEDDDVPSTSQRAMRAIRETISDRASQNWHNISRQLPWIRVMNGAPPMMRTSDLPAGQLANLNIAIGSDETTTLTATTDNYQSIRGPSLLQEDVLKIMDLDDDGQVPTMLVMQQPFDH